jgi:hypothetical protein
MSFSDRYSAATRSKNLRSDPRTTMSDADVIGAAGLAGRTQRLSMALYRLFTGGDDTSQGNCIRIMTRMLVGKAWHFQQVTLTEIEAEDLAKAALAWFRFGTCKVCGGHGYMVLPGQELGDGRAVLGDSPCPACKGTGKVAYDSQFKADRVELMRWLASEVERAERTAGAAAMKALGARMEDM